nr:SMI1/KNR4 family protein [uncultured Caldimonas sp.]
MREGIGEAFEVTVPADVEMAPVQNELWTKLEIQFARHAPELKASLSAPATEAELFEVERETGLALPSEVRSAYLRHDGCERSNETPRYNFLFGSARGMPLMESLERWRQALAWYNESGGDENDYPMDALDLETESVRLGLPRPGWFPIAESSAQSAIYIDFDPGPNGHVGQIVWHRMGAGAGPLAPSLEQYLRYLVDGLEVGSVFLDRGNLCWMDRRTSLPFDATPRA